jgi:hypothetical protein
MKKIVLLILSAFSFVLLNAQQPEDKEAAYTRTINQRAHKIVTNLAITDSAKFYRVRDLVAGQYRTLRDIHDARNARAKEIKADTTMSKADRDTLIKKLDAVRAAKLQVVHKEYLAKLAKELNQEQIDKVKDGMTFGKVAFTYGGYIQMIPSLTDLQKKQIMDWLLEARELAMDAESSDKKTEIFGKYKGRIANYLSKEGYDLKKEQVEWNKRIEAAKKDTSKTK